MENKGEKIINITKKINKVVSIFVVLFIIITLISGLYLFIRPANPRIKMKIKKDIETTNIELDKEAILQLETRENFGEPLNTKDVGRTF